MKNFYIEEAKKNEPNLDATLWQWQSGPSPNLWAEKDPAKWTWQNYSDDDCLLIEKAFSLHKEIADLKDYEVNFNRMVQINKKSKDRIRRVQRKENGRFMLEMPAPVAVQKTMNGAFGTIQHFLEYIMKRTPKAYELYQRLKEISLDCKETLFKDVVQEVIECIEKGAELRKKTLRTKSSLRSESKYIVNLIKSNSASLKDFLKTILKVYTMETFLCYWLNELLRSENWEEMNVLAPYLVCLVYTFKLSDYIIQYQKPQKFLKILVGLIVKQKLSLYRGTALTQEHLELYDPKKVKYFSWNGVTSTSRKKDVGLSFVRMSLTKTGEPKIGVLFSIETDFASVEDCEGMIDISLGSQYPEEQEIIIAPGTVFKLRKTRFIGKGIYEISLRITRKFKTKKEKSKLLGILQDQAILKDKAIIEGLPSQQSFTLLKLLNGNQLIKGLEIKNSVLEEHIMEEIENLRVTTNVKKESIELVDNSLVVSSLGVLAHYFSAEKLTRICELNEIRFRGGGIDKNKSGQIKALSFGGKTLEKFQQNNQLKELGESIKNEHQITELDLAMNEIQNSDYGSSYLLDSLKDLKNLKKMTLMLNAKEITPRENIKPLCKIISGSARALNRLDLMLIASDSDLNLMRDSLLLLTSIQHLSLSFWEKISDEGLEYLKNGIMSLKSLHQLSLYFHECIQISDKGIWHLKTCFRGLPLQILQLGFYKCEQISDEGLKYLKEGLHGSLHLQGLSLHFSECNKISDDGLAHLKTALESLQYLQNLDLSFLSCIKISDEGLNHLSKSFTPLKHLTSVDLNFPRCQEISDEGLNHLKRALKAGKSLKHLKLDFSSCKKISDEVLNCLKEDLASMKSLKYLSLNWESFYLNHDTGKLVKQF